MRNIRLEKLYITRILKDFDCDTFFPSVNMNKWKITKNKDVSTEIQEEDEVQFKYEVFGLSKKWYSRITTKYLLISRAIAV